MTSSSNGAFPQAELQGAIYCWVAGKAPKTDKWNHKANLLTLQQIQEGPKPGWATGYGMVSGRYSGFLCVDVDTKPARPEQPNVTFRKVAKRGLADLPPTATVISGKPNRWRAYFRVPSDWWADLSGYSLNEGDLELRWEDGDPADPAAKQSVISGPHPDGGDLHFRWLEGNRPEDVGIADCPTWLLRGMVLDHQRRQINLELADERKETRIADGELTPIEKLTPAEQIDLLQAMSTAWPYRGGEPGTRWQASYEDDGWNGLLGALFNLFGPDLAELYLAPTEWFKKCEDFGCNTDFQKAVRSVGKSKTQKEAGWGSLHYLATRTESKGGVEFREPGFTWPKHLKPPIEIEVKDMAKEVTNTLNQLKENLHFIDELDQPAAREVAYQRLQKKLGCTEREMKTLLRHLDQENDPASGGKWSDVVKNAKPIVPAIERLLPANCVTMVASDGGVGKSVLLYRIAEAAAYGGKVFGKLQANQGNVLIVQTDESDSNLQQKSKRMEFKDPKDRIHVEFAFNAGMFPDLRNWIRSHGAKYVLMDSFGSLFAGGAELSDSEAGMYLYKLNKIAAEEGCAILMTHHLRKQDKSKNGDRQKVTKGDLYGSAYIVNGCSDVWGITVGEDDQFSLTILKDRSGVSQRGDTFALTGSKEDLSFELSGMNADEDGIDKLKKTEQAVLKSLRARGPEGAITQAELASTLGKSPVTVFRVVTELYAGNWGIQRRRRATTKGKPPWEYWVGGMEGKMKESG